jgi:bifunctional DNase/RNase
MSRPPVYLIGCCLAALALPASVPAAEKKPEASLVKIEKVDVVSSPVGPVVMLQARSRAIPVFVDPVVAESIQAALTGDAIALAIHFKAPILVSPELLDSAGIDLQAPDARML